MSAESSSVSSLPTFTNDELYSLALDLARLVEGLEHLVAYGRDDPDMTLDVELLASMVKGHPEVARKLLLGIELLSHS